MPSRIRRLLLLCVCAMALMAVFAIGANAYETYTYPNMPSDWQNVQVTVGDVTMPFARYPAGSTYSSEKRYMTVEEQKEYGFNIGYSLDLRGWECVGFARYAYAALFYRPSKWPQNSSIDTSLAYSYAGSYAYYDMIEEVLGTRTLEGGYSANTLKKLFTACRPGAVMRCGGHSMVLMAIYNDGFLIYDANFSSDNEVDVRAYTWSSFVDRLGSRGIQALQMPAYYPGYYYSTGDNTYYQVDETSLGTYVVYDCSSLNVRSGPSTSSARVGGLAPGTEVEVLGSYEGWHQIIYQGRARWVYASYLKPVSGNVAVTFDAAGGKASFSSKTYTAGETFGSLPTVTKTNRTFLGWYNGSTRYTASSTVPTGSSLTLTARWAVLTYEDVPEDAWYASYVETAYNRGILSKNSTFAPNEAATRAQMIAALGREYEWESNSAITNSGKTAFQDVPAWGYYAKYVSWAIQTGITKGTSDVTFDPDANVTREQVAIFLYRLATYTGRMTSTSFDLRVLNQFYDAASISSYAKDAMAWAVTVGLFRGDNNGNVNPKGNASRAELITLICRYSENIKAASTKASQETMGEPEEEVAETSEAMEPEAPVELEEAPTLEPAMEAEDPATEAEDPALIPDENGVVG